MDRETLAEVNHFSQAMDLRRRGSPEYYVQDIRCWCSETPPVANGLTLQSQRLML